MSRHRLRPRRRRSSPRRRDVEGAAQILGERRQAELGAHVGEAARQEGARKIEPINEGLDEPNRIVDLDIIVNRLRQQQKLVPSQSGDVSHAPF